MIQNGGKQAHPALGAADWISLAVTGRCRRIAFSKGGPYKLKISQLFQKLIPVSVCLVSGTAESPAFVGVSKDSKRAACRE
jgi:hypothetical protein